VSPFGVDGTLPLHGRGERFGNGPGDSRAPEGVYFGRVAAARELDLFMVDAETVDVAGRDAVGRWVLRGADAPFKSVDQLAKEDARWAIQTMDLVAKFEALIVGLGEAIARFAQRGAR
jgi:hypothetical protein